MDENMKILTIWRFFQKLHHNCSRKKAEDILGKKIHPKDFPDPNPDFEKDTQQQKIWSEKYLQKAKRFVPWLRFFPGIRAIAVCNSVAMETAEKSSDIDLLIITAPNKLWTARIFATLYFQTLGMRRYRKKISGRFCLSFFATEDALDFEKIAIKPKDSYLAFWVSSLIPVFGRGVFEAITTKNKDFVTENGGIKIRFQQIIDKVPSGNSAIKSTLEVLLGTWFEKTIKKIFLPRTLKKRDSLADASGTIISEKILKFHNSDKRKEFLSLE